MAMEFILLIIRILHLDALLIILRVGAVLSAVFIDCIDRLGRMVELGNLFETQKGSTVLGNVMVEFVKGLFTGSTTGRSLHTDFQAGKMNHNRAFTGTRSWLERIRIPWTFCIITNIT